MDSTPFDFFTEIKKENNYQLLYPDRKVGLAIVWLYQQTQNGTFPNKAFKEADIHRALGRVNPASQSKAHKVPTSHYNIIVAELQEYFLRYDEEGEVYRFKEYGSEFCKHALNTLKSNFDPTQIEKICIDLKDHLNRCNTAVEVQEWLEIKFDNFRPNLKHQIDFLDRQIDQSVSELQQNKITEAKGKVLETLKQISERFDTIRTHNKELRSAFREFEHIKELLLKRSMSIEDKYLGDLIFEALQFFQEMKKLLSLIDNRLDRIQPKVKQLFANLNKPLFNTKIEQFLRFLLENSTLDTEKKKMLMLPEGIPDSQLFKENPSFTIVERKEDLFPTKARKKKHYTQNTVAKKEAFMSTKERFLQNDHVDYWFSEIKRDLQSQMSVNFSKYFFEALSQSNNDIGLAVALTYRVLREYPNYDWKLNIRQEIDMNFQQGSTQLWNMTIEQN